MKFIHWVTSIPRTGVLNGSQTLLNVQNEIYQTQVYFKHSSSPKFQPTRNFHWMHSILEKCWNQSTNWAEVDTHVQRRLLWKKFQKQPYPFVVFWLDQVPNSTDLQEGSTVPHIRKWRPRINHKTISKIHECYGNIVRLLTPQPFLKSRFIPQRQPWWHACARGFPTLLDQPFRCRSIDTSHWTHRK